MPTSATYFARMHAKLNNVRGVKQAPTIWCSSCVVKRWTSSYTCCVTISSCPVKVITMDVLPPTKISILKWTLELYWTLSVLHGYVIKSNVPSPAEATTAFKDNLLRIASHFSCLRGKYDNIMVCSSYLPGIISDLSEVVQKPLKTNPGLNARLLLYYSNFFSYVTWSLRSVKIKT